MSLEDIKRRLEALGRYKEESEESKEDKLDKVLKIVNEHSLEIKRIKDTINEYIVISKQFISLIDNLDKKADSINKELRDIITNSIRMILDVIKEDHDDAVNIIKTEHTFIAKKIQELESDIKELKEFKDNTTKKIQELEELVANVLNNITKP